MNLAERAAAVRERIEAAAGRAGRSPGDIVLVGVTKTFSADVCRRAIEAGVVDLGENRAQELREKSKLVNGGVRWHFIGHLQTNKVRTVVGASSLIHSVDRRELAAAISRRAEGTGITQEVLVQVNVVGDASKHGARPEHAVDLAAAVDALPGVDVRGLMTMPPYPLDPEDSRPAYKELATLGNALLEQLPSARELSMGMTRDFEVAVEEGATLVRVGEALFGARNAP
jgi:PLP dependent protein